MDQLNIKTRLLTDPVEQTPNPLHKVDRYYKEGNATTLLSTFKRGLLPMKRAPRTCNTGISNGKLNGVIIATWSTPPYTKAWPSALQIRTGGQVLEFGLNEKEHLSFKEAQPEETTHE
jgi:hypothetical protein